MIMQERVSFYVSDQENYNEPYIYLCILKGFFWKNTFSYKNYEKNSHKNIITNILLRSIIVGRDLFNIYDRTL